MLKNNLQFLLRTSIFLILLKCTNAWKFLPLGLSDNYTNYSIRSACIPLVESICEEALQTESGGVLPQKVAPSLDIIKPIGNN